jgi:hypothetical protein
VRGDVTGQETILDQPGFRTTEDSTLVLHFVDSERSFQLGERIRLQASELYDTIITLWRFGLAAAQAVEGYGRSLGIQFPAPSADATLHPEALTTAALPEGHPSPETSEE